MRVKGKISSLSGIRDRVKGISPNNKGTNESTECTRHRM